MSDSDLTGLAGRENGGCSILGSSSLPPIGTTPSGASVVVEQRPQPRGLINALLVRRRDERGDLVGTLALWSFLAMIFCLCLGGSVLEVGGLRLTVPVLDISALVGLLGPIVGHVVKSTMEARQ